MHGKLLHSLVCFSTTATYDLVTLADGREWV